MGDLTNLPTPGSDSGTWGDELNTALTELDTKKASAAEVYDKDTADGRFIRTVNGVGPDIDGDVAVAGGDGGGGTFSGIPLDGSVTDAKIAAGGLSASKITGTAIINSDARLSDTRVPKPHKASHATGGTDVLIPSDIGAMSTAARGVANGVAPLDINAVVPAGNLPTMVRPGGTGASFRIWVQPTAPSAGDGAADGHVWIQTA